MVSGDSMNYSINSINEASPPHCHTNYEVIVCTKGEGVFTCKDGKITLFPGTIIIVPPNTVHSSTFEKEYERIYISGEFNRIFNLHTPTVVLDNPQEEGTLLAKMIYRNRYAGGEYVSALSMAFAQFLVQNLKNDSEISLAVKEIVNVITDSFFESNFDLKHLLKKSGYAEDYIRAEFRKITGYTPVEFLTKVRINQACFLIDMYGTSLQLSEIAEKCGYTDYVYFSRRFKSVMNLSPREYLKLK